MLEWHPAPLSYTCSPISSSKSVSSYILSSKTQAIPKLVYFKLHIYHSTTEWMRTSWWRSQTTMVDKGAANRQLNRILNRNYTQISAFTCWLVMSNGLWLPAQKHVKWSDFSGDSQFPQGLLEARSSLNLGGCLCDTSENSYLSTSHLGCSQRQSLQHRQEW